MVTDRCSHKESHSGADCESDGWAHNPAHVQSNCGSQCDPYLCSDAEPNDGTDCGSNGSAHGPAEFYPNSSAHV